MACTGLKSEDVKPASNNCSASRAASTGRDWLTNVDAPAGFEFNRSLGSLFNWDQFRAGLLPSTAPVAPAPVPPAETLASASSSAVSRPATRSTSTSNGALYPSVLDAQKLVSRPLGPKHDDLVCRRGELQSHSLNNINPPASTVTKLHPTASSNGTPLAQTHHFAELQSQNTTSFSSSALVMNKGPRQQQFSNGAILPHNHHHFLPSPGASPSRKRSLNDLATYNAPPTRITRPRSIPLRQASRFMPPGLIPLNPLSDFRNALQLQPVAHSPNFYNNNKNSSSSSSSSSSNSNIHNNNLLSNTPHPTAEPRFVPMLSITRPDRTGRDFTPFLQQSTHHALYPLKFSPRYHGMHTENNASMEHLPPEQNCALWLTNLPPDIRERELLSCIRNMGRIYATYINYPDGHAHATSAAKLVFFRPEAAQKLLAHCTLVKPMVIRGHHVKIALNRIKYAKNSMENGESRVLIITGHKNFVNETSLMAYFEARFQFQIDEVATLITHKERAVVEFKFGSYRCQAQMGMKALLLDRPAGLEMVEYGADPCEVGSEVTSFTVAGERIQGRGLLLKESVGS
ncbi:hypothetical protein E4U41_004390 [Claviceps citrina]|nr:hypothetical protein E4U41_004390 [Claviceps citrina]